MYIASLARLLAYGAEDFLAPRALDLLGTCIDYARVPYGFWKEKGKKLMNIVARAAPKEADEVAASYHKNPLR